MSSGPGARTEGSHGGVGWRSPLEGQWDRSNGRGHSGNGGRPAPTEHTGAREARGRHRRAWDSGAQANHPGVGAGAAQPPAAMPPRLSLSACFWLRQPNPVSHALAPHFCSRPAVRSYPREGSRKGGTTHRGCAAPGPAAVPDGELGSVWRVSRTWTAAAGGSRDPPRHRGHECQT